MTICDNNLFLSYLPGRRRMMKIVRSAHYYHSPVSSKEHGVSHDHDRTRRHLMFRESVCIQLRSDPLFASVILAGQLIYCAIIMGVLLPKNTL